MNSALISMLEKKAFEEITIKEICDEAGVNRSTFYHHYDNVNDLLSETIENAYKNFFEHFGADVLRVSDVSFKTEEELFLIKPEYLRPYLEFVEENRKLFRLMYDRSSVFGAQEMYNKWFDEIFSPILARYGVSAKERPLMMIFFLKGILGVVTEWVKDDCRASKEDIVNVITKCIIRP